MHAQLREWRAEGVNDIVLEVSDTSGVLELMDRPLAGIFALVDSFTVGKRNSSSSDALDLTDVPLLAKIQQEAALSASGVRSPFFALAGPTSAYKRTDTDFVVRHTFGSVIYSCLDFVQSNFAGVSAPIAELLRDTSTDAFVSLLFSGEQPRGLSASSPTVAQRWSADLSVICDRLSTSPVLHVVQCIKVWTRIMSSYVPS